MTLTRPDPVPTDRGQVDVVEELVTSAPLGLRFWDWALDQPVRDGLLVRARPAAGGPVTTARPSSRGVHGFLSLPTTRAAEQGTVADFADEVPYDVSVVDTRGRYVPVGFTVEAPAAGVQPGPATVPDLAGGSAPLPGFYLFSAATRVAPPGFVGARLELRDQSRPVPGAVGEFAPAAHALVRLALDDPAGDIVWWGVSDAQGRVVVLAPAPGFATPSDGDGPLDPSDQSWQAELEVRYEALEPDDFTGVPDFADIADQDVAAANHDGNAFTSSRVVDIEYGQVLVVRSPGRSDLLVQPA